MRSPSRAVTVIVTPRCGLAACSGARNCTVTPRSAYAGSVHVMDEPLAVDTEPLPAGTGWNLPVT